MSYSFQSNYIQEKTKEKQKLEEDIEKLKTKELDARTELMLALDEKKATLAELEQFSPLKVELDKLGISVEDIPRTTNIILGVPQRRGSPSFCGTRRRSKPCSNGCPFTPRNRSANLSA